MMGESCVCLGSIEIWVFGSFRPFFKKFQTFQIFWKTVGFLCFRGIHNSLPSFWAKLGYFPIKIDHISDPLLKLQIKIGVHLINAELSQLLTLQVAGCDKTCFSKMNNQIEMLPSTYSKRPALCSTQFIGGWKYTWSI